ncbi:gliding motility-associated C-terminal domain-containing protein [Flavobacterium sp. J372]|uniref:gliding motility-associated C-terminal domain-containing protein n=1 Tax=Flavobacterium sp. J372 TaxID=2898436 RepID=UPI002150B5B8|nr:gliding motility-associated C-terminal domain-containing protein [Flavobacterium sp. J372]MCR5861313.1 gliding motility-associated C-terminal domain-containing protein [Flavobacterium sp. J372]
MYCPPNNNDNSFVSGFNDNDKIELLKNGQRIDIVNTPSSQPGFTMIRKPDAIAPDAVYESNDWNITLHNDTTPNNYCDNLGSHGTTPPPAPTITMQPANIPVCPGGDSFFEIAISAPAGFTYQWKVLNAAGNWVNVANNANYSGATTNKLILNDIPASFEGNQYYCVATLGTCILASNAVQLSLIAPPAAPVAVVIQPTCTTPAIITVTPVASVTYSIDGINYQASNIFNNVAANTYNITVKNAAGCVSPAVAVTVNPAPGAPAAPVAVVTQPTCTSAATITVTPVAGVTYSIDGINYQASNVFNNVSANTYNVTIKNAAGCVSPAVAVTVNPAPGAPAAPVAVVTQPTCTTPAIITVTPVAGVTYSIDGINYQTSNIFNNVPANTYNVTVKNAAGCVSLAVSVTVNTVPGAPAAPVAVVTQPTCTTPATITVTPVAGVTYSIDGINYQASNVFNNVSANTYNVTIKNAAGCVSPAVAVTVNPAPGAPAAPVAVVTQPTCTTPAIITVTPVAGVTYSIDGINYQASNIFNNVAANTYNITVKNAAGCVSPAVAVTVNPAPGAPAAPVAVVTQPTCTTPAIITVTPVAGVTYSIDGINYQTSNIFNNVPANTYNVTVKNAAGCVSPAVSVVVNTVPGAPAAPVAVVTQPTCTTPAIITATPVAGVTYSIDGINYQASNIFNNVAANTYNVTVKNAAGCVSPAITVTVNPDTGVIPEIGSTEGCRETISGRKYILEALPLNNSFDVATSAFEWRDASGQLLSSGENTFDATEYFQENTVQFPFNITVKVTANGGCSQTFTFIINGIFCDVPKGISPNNDSKNDSFNLAGLNVSRLLIYNRYGKEVYSKNNYVNEWHGQGSNDNELPTGTYYYIIEASGTSKTGWVYINREN